MEAVRFFSSLLSHTPTDYSGLSVEAIGELISFRCSEGDKSLLVKEITEEEVRNVVNSMPSDKTPGPDGYTVEFFKEAWQIVGKDVMVAVQSFFIYGFLPKD